MNQERNPSIKMVEEFRKNFLSFSDSIGLAYQALNNLVAECGVTEDIKKMAQSIYLIKLSYFNLQKEQLKTIKQNLDNDNFEEVSIMLSSIKTQIGLSIESTLNELEESKQ